MLSVSQVSYGQGLFFFSLVSYLLLADTFVKYIIKHWMLEKKLKKKICKTEARI